MAQRLEQGGWIIDSGDGDYSFEGLGSDWVNSSCGINPPSTITVPDNAVGFVHSHPFSEGEDRRSICGNDVREKYESGYSFEDLEFLIKIAGIAGDFAFKGYVIDGNKITEYGTLSQQTQYARCGY